MCLVSAYDEFNCRGAEFLAVADASGSEAVEKPMKPLGDRRARVRFEVVGTLWGALDLHESSRIVDISRSGVLVESSLALPPDSVQPVRLEIGGEEVRVDGRVRHLRRITDENHAAYLIGLEFLSPPAPVVAFVDQLLVDGGANPTSAKRYENP